MLKCIGIIANKNDNVCTVVEEAKKGSSIMCKYINILEKEIEVYTKKAIPVFHKVAIKDILIGEDIIKYGEVIGRANSNIYTGEHVHIHNVDSKRVQGNILK